MLEHHRIILFYLIFIVSALLGYNTKREQNIDTSYNSRSQPIQTAERSVVNVTVYYETLCPASIDFLVQQLGPVTKRLASHLNIHLVPYGHATTWNRGGRLVFSCQHGPPECYGNKLHACAVDALQNVTKAVLFNACLMRYTLYNPDTGYDYVAALNWCGYQLDVYINGVWDCVNSERGSTLLKRYGDETKILHPRYVPFVVLDDSTEKQNQATNNLFQTVCSLLNPVPNTCYS